MNYTLITGASRGIGRAIALECGDRMMNLVLVARSLEELVELKNEITEKNDVDVQCLQLDLLDGDCGKFIAEYIESNNLGLNLLINNAGIGDYNEFISADNKKLMDVIQLNVKSLVNITHHLIPFLKNNDESYILNVASTAALQPVAHMSTYAGTKSFVYFWSRALRIELKPLGVKVCCLLPGPVETKFTDVAGISYKKGLISAMKISPQKVAKKAIRGVFHNRPIIIPGIFNRIQFILFSLLPSRISEKIVGMVMKNQR